MIKRWLAYNKDYSILKEMKEELNISESLARILINRDINTLEDAEAFLNPDMDELEDSFMLKGMDSAVERVYKAIKAGEKVCIYGDYDVDGITSLSMLYLTLKKLGANVIYYIPNRLEEGYGINIDAIERIIDEGVDLIISVDCGIRSIEEVKFINENNKEIIITDHHECGDEIPKACSVINPHQSDCYYPFKDFAGAGVAFKLVCALAQRFSRYDLPDDIIDLAALGTVADVVPLLGENRVIVKNGLEKIRNNPNLGIKALTKVSGIDICAVDTYHISFMLAPRLNAAGRISDPILGVKLLIAEEEEAAMKIAEELNKANSHRQTIENEILNSAMQIIDKTIDKDIDRIIVAAGENWHIGVIGIVASKLTEKYGLPVVLISLEDGIGRGSARSIPGFDLYEAMNKCSFLFERFGGHQMAAGLTIKEENIEKLKCLLNEIAWEMMADKHYVPEIFIDYKIDSISMLSHLIEELEMLEPYGEGNPVPIFVFRGLTIEEMKLLGNNKHLSMKLNDGTDTIRGIGFNIGFIINYIAVNEKIDIICSVEKNLWNGTEYIQLNIKDIKKAK